ncbi:medium-chain acyl-CoA ligase ACSF2, mitochondrial-like [Lampetra fluviatilis]
MLPLLRPPLLRLPCRGLPRAAARSTLLRALHASRGLCSTGPAQGPENEEGAEDAGVGGVAGATPARLTWSYVHGASRSPLLGTTLGAHLELTARAQPQRALLVCAERRAEFTYSHLLERADRMAAGLLALGVTRGDRLGIWGPNSVEWALTALAAARAGIVLVNINPAYQPQELEFALKKVGCKGIVSAVEFKGRNYLDLLTQLCPELPSSCPGDLHSARLPDLRVVISLGEGEPSPGALSVREVEGRATPGLEAERHAIHSALSCDDPINIQYTSGTTGQPKGATLTHHNILNNAHLLGERMGYHWRDVRVALPVPLYHCFGLVAGLLGCVAHSGTLVLPSAAYSARATLTAIQTHRCTVLYGTPTMFVDMLNDPDFHSFDLSSLQTGIVAGSPCPPELFRRVVDSMKLPDFVNAYGTTENSPVTFCGFPRDDINTKMDAVGRVLQHLEAKVVGPGSSSPPLRVGEQGELCVRGHCVMRGYWGDSGKTQECITPDGWYHTGDVAVMDELGYCRIVGRLKDLIIRGGENIYPAEVEALLHTHPAVLEAQVVGVHDERMGEEACACLRLQPGVAALSARDLHSFCNTKIAHFKIPKYVEIVDSYPLTVTGKIQKFKLREQMEKKLGLK